MNDPKKSEPTVNDKSAATNEAADGDIGDQDLKEVAGGISAGIVTPATPPAPGSGQKIGGSDIG